MAKASAEGVLVGVSFYCRLPEREQAHNTTAVPVQNKGLQKFLFCLFGLTVEVMAQSSIPSGTLIGTIVDAEDALTMPGAHVVLSGTGNKSCASRGNENYRTKKR